LFSTENKELKRGTIRIRKSKDRVHREQKKDKRTNNDPQNNTQKTKDRATRTRKIPG